VVSMDGPRLRHLAIFDKLKCPLHVCEVLTRLILNPFKFAAYSSLGIVNTYCNILNILVGFCSPCFLLRSSDTFHDMCQYGQ
jgi:hypothetical protein